MRRALSIGVVVMLTACGTHSEERACTAEVESAIVSGGPSAELLAANTEQMRAVVEVVLDVPLSDDEPNGGSSRRAAVCSGVLVAPDFVATANHCVEAARVAGVRVAGGLVPAAALHPHPDFDFLLIELPAGSTTATPLGLGDEPLGPELVGRPAQIAGYGAGSGGGAAGFLAVTIDGVDGRSITVNAAGRGGACLGDSGGPLMVRGKDGAVRVLGVLAEGSASCKGEDAYTRIDLVRSFIEAVTGPLATGAGASCGDLDGAGRCFGSRAVWCDAGVARASDCTGGAGCGWDAAEGGFRCVDPELDPCVGVGDLGRCDGKAETHCEKGRLVTTACSSCGTGCAVSTSSGRAGCGG